MTIVHTTVPTEVSAKLDARQGQFTVYDYERSGDTRPYQVVMPAYPAPKFLQTFMNLRDGIRECDTLCRLHGRPFRLVKWGSKYPCVPCGMRQGSNRLPKFTIRSRGALEGYPEAVPVAEASPTKGVTVFTPQGEARVGAPNYVASTEPFPLPPGTPTPQGPINQNYLQAVQTAQYLAGRTGQRAYVCAGFGSDCKSGKSYLPVVYVDPGALARRYPEGFPLGPNAASTPGSTSITTPVSPAVFQELLRQSEGRTKLGQGA